MTIIKQGIKTQDMNREVRAIRDTARKIVATKKRPTFFDFHRQDDYRHDFLSIGTGNIISAFNQVGVLTPSYIDVRQCRILLFANNQGPNHYISDRIRFRKWSVENTKILINMRTTCFVKIPLKLLIRKCAAIFLMFATVLFSGFGCDQSKPSLLIPDPLRNFHDADLYSNKAIVDDYQAYILALPPKGEKVSGPTLFYEGENGQHAVKAEVFTSGTTSETYIFIYDRENKRTQVIKYHSNRYQS